MSWFQYRSSGHEVPGVSVIRWEDIGCNEISNVERWFQWPKTKGRLTSLRVLLQLGLCICFWYTQLSLRLLKLSCSYSHRWCSIATYIIDKNHWCLQRLPVTTATVVHPTQKFGCACCKWFSKRNNLEAKIVEVVRGYWKYLSTSAIISWMYWSWISFATTILHAYAHTLM